MAAAAVFACTLLSCLGPRKIDKWVVHHYQPDATESASIPQRRKRVGAMWYPSSCIGITITGTPAR
jgi:hypothetical protein